MNLKCKYSEGHWWHVYEESTGHVIASQFRDAEGAWREAALKLFNLTRHIVHACDIGSGDFYEASK